MLRLGMIRWQIPPLPTPKRPLRNLPWIQQKGVGGDLEVAPRGVSSSHCFPLSVILTGSIGDREGGGVTYKKTVHMFAHFVLNAIFLDTSWP